MKTSSLSCHVLSLNKLLVYYDVNFCISKLLVYSDTWYSTKLKNKAGNFSHTYYFTPYDCGIMKIFNLPIICSLNMIVIFISKLQVYYNICFDHNHIIWMTYLYINSSRAIIYYPQFNIYRHYWCHMSSRQTVSSSGVVDIFCTIKYCSDTSGIMREILNKMNIIKTL